VWFRRGRAPTISLYVGGVGPAPAGLDACLPPAVVLREDDGAMTAQYAALRVEMGGPEAPRG
jgi:hypothetical protein